MSDAAVGHGVYFDEADDGFLGAHCVCGWKCEAVYPDLDLVADAYGDHRAAAALALFSPPTT